MTMPELHEFVPYPLTPQDKPGHVCNGSCACAVCSQNRSVRAVHYQARDRRRPKAAWYRADRGRGGGWSFAHLFATVDGPIVQSACGYQPGRAGQRVIYAPALPTDPRCSRCERLEAM
jgi:hypothetical protein